MKTTLFIPLLLILQSCVVQILGITNDYKKLTDEQKSIVKPIESFDKLYAGEVYPVNATQLRTEIKKYPKAIVYIFANGCPSKLCKPLFVYEDFARKNGYKLFLIMNGFGAIDATLAQKISSPLFAIDADYYNTVFSIKYGRYFENELAGRDKEEKQKEFLGSLYFFENGEFTKITKELPNEASL